MDKFEMHRQELTGADKWLRAFAANHSDVNLLFDAHNIILALMCLVQSEDLDRMIAKNLEHLTPKGNAGE